MKNFLILLFVGVNFYLASGNVLLRSVRETVQDVIANAESLSAKAKQKMVLNASSGMAALTQEVAQLEKLIEQLKAAHAGTTVYMIEKQIGEIETKLQSQFGVYYENGHTREVLLYRAQSLEKRTTEAIAQLNANGKSSEIAVLEKDNTLVKYLVAQLQQTHSGANLEHIEQELRSAELSLQNEMKRLNLIPGVFYENSHNREVLLYRATSLQKRANDAIQQLKAQGKSSEGSLIEKDETLVKQFMEQLQVTHSTANLTQIEQELREAEVRLQQELTRLNLVPSTPSRRDLKQDLIVRGNALVEQARDKIKQLQIVHNTHGIAIIAKEMANIEKSVKELESTTDVALIERYESELRLTELRMAFELNGIDHPESNPEELLKQILIERATTLEQMAADMKVKMSALSKETTQLDQDLVKVKQLIAEFKNGIASGNILQKEGELTIAENQLISEIRKMQLSF